MSTTKSQRIGIWIIAVVLAVGTIGSFFVIILANNNQKIDQQNAQTEYQKLIEDMRKSNKPLDGYSVQKFDADSVKELKVETLKKVMVRYSQPTRRLRLTILAGLPRAAFSIVQTKTVK